MVVLTGDTVTITTNMVVAMAGKDKKIIINSLHCFIALKNI